VLQVLFALRDSKVARLIPDQPTFIDTPNVPASSAIVIASEEVPQVQDLEVDLSKIDLAKLEELPNCTNGELPLLAKFYKVTRHVEIQQPCNVTADGTTLLVTTTLKFVKTARLDGKLSVKAMNALEGPCLAFQSDAFVAASAELHFTNCHNILQPLQPNDDILDDGGLWDFDLMQINALDAEDAEVDGGAMNVRGSLMVMGSLTIRDCSTEGDGGAIAVKRDFFHSNGSISIINSSSGQNGGAIYVEQSFNHSGGSISVQGTSAAENGGAIYVEQNFNHSGGRISVQGSSAEMNGGAICVNKHFTQSGGSLVVTNSSARSDGGAISVRNFTHSGGSISVEGSSAVRNAGAIYVLENFTQSGGSIAVTNSSAQESGGAIYVWESFHHWRGSISVQGSSAVKSGGAINVKQNFHHSGGSISVQGSSADMNGGAINVKQNFHHSGGRISVQGSSAEMNGGAIYVDENFTQSGGSLAVMKSSAARGGLMTIPAPEFFWGALFVDQNFIHSAKNGDGGAIYVKKHFTQSGGSLAMTNSSARYDGGAIYVEQNFNHSGGRISVQGSSAEMNGGAIYVDENFTQSGGSLAVKNSSAQRSGGAINVKQNFHHSGGSISVQGSSAEMNGGGLFVVEHMVFTNATAAFSQCHAGREGGGINTLGNVSITNASLSFELATTDGGGAALLADALEQVGGRMTVYNSSASGASGAVIDATAWAIDGGSFRIEHCTSKSFLIAAKHATLRATSFDVADCSAAGMLVSSSEVLLRNSVFNKTSLPQVRAPVVNASNCTIMGSEAWISAEKAIVKDIDCDVPFAAYYDEGDGLGCKSCDPGTLFVKNSTTNTIGSKIQRCVPCPDGAKICNATAVEMMPGRMVELSNLSRSFHCPNQLACRGGIVSSNVSTLMCAGGYEGEGCSQCAEGCARSDSNVFICVRCAEGLLRKVKDVLVFLLSNTLLFVVSAAGVINAQGRNKNSAVYLNQLMSFAAVTAPALLALQQTGTFNEQMQQLGKATIAFFSIPVQAGDAGESSVSISTECLQRYMGMEPSLLFSQLLSSLLYIVLMLCLALKSGRSIAAVVGVNCFLPKVCATFGWYLIVYRMEPLGERLSLLEAQHRVAGMVIAVLAIILCFMVGPGSWIKMTRDKSVIDKPHVLFLTRSYRKGFETWEVEKLTRRMVLKVISTVFPITLNPSMQMAGVTLVLMASLVLHATQAPYAKAGHFWMKWVLTSMVEF